MDRSWVWSRKFFNEHISGVKEFMDFIKERFGENDEILCPCSRCLNHKYLHQANIRKHLLMNGMECTYNPRIHHGEDINLDVNEVAAQSAITQMGTKISEPAEDQQTRSVTKGVAGVLAQNTKKMKNAELRSQVNSQREQMDEWSTKLQEIEQAIRNLEEIAKKQAELDAKLDLLLSKRQRN